MNALLNSDLLPQMTTHAFEMPLQRLFCRRGERSSVSGLLKRTRSNWSNGPRRGQGPCCRGPATRLVRMQALRRWTWHPLSMEVEWHYGGARPASGFNPDGPHGPSEVVNPRDFVWDSTSRGHPWAQSVIYEMHIGTFTSEGTYVSALDKLPELVNLGMTAVELMPLSTFPGIFGWGYDGVLPYAPFAGDGSPADLKLFIQEAHRLGLMFF